MLRGLQVGFGALIGSDLLASLRGLGVEMIRLGFPRPQTTATEIRAMLTEVRDAGLTPLAIITTEQALLLPSDWSLDVELYNEPDIGTPPTPRMTSAEYAQRVQRAHAIVGERHRLWAGSVSNLDEDSLDWLRHSIPYWPESVGVSVHRYPCKGAPPTLPQDGFASRQAEVDALKAIIGSRPWCVSEFGYHTAEWTTGWWFWRKRYRWTDEQVAAFVAWEWAFWERAGAVSATLYQINDGAEDTALGRFGIRDIGGTWKPVAHTFAPAR
jgi:hypothetical protein